MTNLTCFIALLACTMLLPLGSGDLISETCSQTPNDRLCATTLRKDNRSRDADIAGLALIVVDALQVKANATFQQIRGIQKSNIRLANALMICNENYNVILKIDIPKAVGSLRQKNPRLAEHGMADAGIEAQGCESSFEKPTKSPLSDMNDAVYDLSVVALSIIRIMLHRFY